MSMTSKLGTVELAGLGWHAESLELLWVYGARACQAALPRWLVIGEKM